MPRDFTAAELKAMNEAKSALTDDLNDAYAGRAAAHSWPRVEVEPTGQPRITELPHNMGLSYNMFMLPDEKEKHVEIYPIDGSKTPRNVPIQASELKLPTGSSYYSILYTPKQGGDHISLRGNSNLVTVNAPAFRETNFGTDELTVYHSQGHNYYRSTANMKNNLIVEGGDLEAQTGGNDDVGQVRGRNSLLGWRAGAGKDTLALIGISGDNAQQVSISFKNDTMIVRDQTGRIRAAVSEAEEVQIGSGDGKFVEYSVAELHQRFNQKNHIANGHEALGNLQPLQILVCKPENLPSTAKSPD